MSRFKRTFGGLSAADVTQTPQDAREQAIQLLQSGNPFLTKEEATILHDATQRPLHHGMTVEQVEAGMQRYKIRDVPQIFGICWYCHEALPEPLERCPKCRSVQA